MKVSVLLGERYKNAPADCIVESQALMVRGGYIKQVGSGIYSLFTPAKRIMNKIEDIIREEMDAIDGQEVMFPVVMPASLWRESGRFDSIGSELLRFKDRTGNDMVLGMTHEEAAVQLARDTAQTYTKYPFMIYQIQTKFRDEPRARGGLIRVREFTMKDAYSFHRTQEDLEQYYEKCYKAYERIFERCGLKNVVAVKSDSGMMGGKVSHEFMLLTDIGEDTLVICDDCDYRSNMEAADSITVNDEKYPAEALSELHTPGVKTIDQLCGKVGRKSKYFCKAVVYRVNEDDSHVVVFIRGDLEVNETKLRNYLGKEIHPAADIDESLLTPGFIGPVGISKEVKVVYDESLKGAHNLVCGANKTDYHLTGLDLERDVEGVTYVSVAKAVSGGICPKCGRRSLKIKKGVEIGNIFQLGTKYSEVMGLRYSDENGELQTPIMGCYGIGVGRLCACICQENRDNFGPVWPKSVAPWQVEVCALRADEQAVKECAEKLVKDLEDMGVQVLYDDRPVSAGFMFSDADLLGVPVRAIVSPKNIDGGVIEIATRDKSVRVNVPMAEALTKIKELI
ncbi:MAG: proline--tRNA ligase [Ruminococcaceae bacterium]|nr:proline--tRNA ligase [Oscillospiraceae bacterium]